MLDFYKKNKRTLKVMAVFSLVLVLAACGTPDRAAIEPIGPDSPGMWNGIIYHLSQFIVWLSHTLGYNYGLGILAFTVITQIVLLPMTLYQQRNMEKQMAIQPEMEALQKKYSARDEQTMMKLQDEMRRVKSEAGISNWTTFLPLIIQMPIFLLLYQAVVRTPELATGTFLWMKLGYPDPYYVIPLIAAASMILNTYLTQYGREQAGGKVMMFLMPTMIFFVTFKLSSSISIYFAARNIITVLTTLIFNNPFKRIERQEAEAEAEREQERRRRQALRKAKRTGRNVKM